MLISELFDAICWEISVESGSTDFQLVDDITDEWIIFCVFEHRFSMLDGLFIHCPWTIATGSFKDAHFATFPPALVEPCIRAGTSERGVCPECGAPWVRHTKPATTTSWVPSCECVNAGLKLLHSPERKYLSLTGIGLSIDPHSGVPPNSDAVVRGCGQTGGRCLGFRLCLTVGCV